MKTVKIALLLAAMAGAVPALAFKQVQDPALASQAVPHDPRAVPRATLGWDKLADTMETQRRVQDVDRLVAVFGSGVEALDGQPFTVAGFFLPLDTGETSRSFLLSSLAPTCPFCPPPGPADLIQVSAAEPVTATLDQVKLEGTLRLSAEDVNGIYFHLENARVVPKS
ncbi:DUF3299 domain-containing protein [Niveispirillum sp.]|uniref:DUF3299 domain-containing protein n=1 Tax=Niveispirillum sp. TaxID=1917217 RepID=UPI001B7AF6B2|nr:DUF3299 domain-containing protein [Niveispirillum sp.]MBP7339672.1 DUF3299 domain-containing protein [Niveispirillum sp.]